jgi:integrase
MAKVKQRHDIDGSSIKHLFANNFPVILKALQMIDDENLQRKRRLGYNLVPRESKKHGIIWYARYTHNGKAIPTKFNTHTSNEAEAEKIAIENKTRWIEQYLSRKDGHMFKLLEGFYSKNSDNPDLMYLSEQGRQGYNTVIQKKFIPYLKGEKITSFEQIKAISLVKYQDKLLSGEISALNAGRNKTGKKPLRPQTVNNCMKPIRKIFAYLHRKGIISENIADSVKGLPVRQSDSKARGCYELEQLKGVFNKKWEDQLSYILCLLIYTTGMRNSEIVRIKMEDIIKIEDCRFIQVKESKTMNGIRLVPIHDFVYRRLAAWVEKTKKEGYLFRFENKKPFVNANTCLGDMLGVKKEKIEEEYITFYSGRHFWKTLMSAEGLGEDIEEVFMGHKVVSNVARLYNHRDKLGKGRLAKKAKHVFTILDSCIFTKAART